MHAPKTVTTDKRKPPDLCKEIITAKPAAHTGAAGYGSCGWFGIWEFFPKAIANTPYGMCVKLLYEENTMSVPSAALSTSIRVNPSVVLS